MSWKSTFDTQYSASSSSTKNYVGKIFAEGSSKSPKSECSFANANAIERIVHSGDTTYVNATVGGHMSNSNDWRVTGRWIQPWLSFSPLTARRKSNLGEIEISVSSRSTGEKGHLKCRRCIDRYFLWKVEARLNSIIFPSSVTHCVCVHAYVRTCAHTQARMLSGESEGRLLLSQREAERSRYGDT